MLILPAEPANSGFPGHLKNRNIERLSADTVLCRLALLFGDAEQGVVGHGFHESVAQQVDRKPGGSDVLAVGHPLLKLDIWKGCIAADGAVVHQGSASDDGLPAVDRDGWVFELPVRSAMPHPKLSHLAYATRCRILMAFAAVLRVVKRAEAVRNLLNFFELGLVGRMRCLVHRAVRLIVKSGRCFRAL